MRPMRPRMMHVRQPAETALAAANNRQLARIAARAKLIPRSTAAYRICIVVGGRGTFRRLADLLAPLIGDAVLEAGDPVATVEAIRNASLGRFPRVVLIAPANLAGPIHSEIERIGRRWGLGWPAPVDLLMGLRSRDREAFLRKALRTARGAR